MKEEQLIIPIVVNEKYEIIDGQHRTFAYHEGDDIEILDEWIQTPRGWVASRYVQQ